MIFDHLSKASLYHLSSRFASGFKYIRDFHPSLADGRYPIEGDDVYALVQTFESAPAVEKQFESHEVYADIHYIVSGSEVIYYCPSSELIPKAPYDPSVDATYYQDHDDLPLVLRAGFFMIFLQHDAHKPACIDPAVGAIEVRKVVIKVRLA